jgi:hypothetical protein
MKLLSIETEAESQCIESIKTTYGKNEIKTKIYNNNLNVSQDIYSQIQQHSFGLLVRGPKKNGRGCRQEKNLASQIGQKDRPIITWAWKTT